LNKLVIFSNSIINNSINNNNNNISNSISYNLLSFSLKKKKKLNDFVIVDF